MIFDTHTHYDYKNFNLNRDVLLNEMYQKGITKIVNPAISFDSNITMREKLEKYPWIFFTTGIHPKYITEEQYVGEDIQHEKAIREFAKDIRTVAIGETGLDYHYSQVFKERQAFWFRKQINIALDTNLPLILHIREADEDAIKILKDYPFKENFGIVHCFNSSYEIAKTYIDMGFLLGIGGTITLLDKEYLRDVVKNIPLESIVLETDAPFIKPLNWEGSNTSLSLPIVAQTIADVKKIPIESVYQKTFDTASKLFNV
ncbi:MAG: TatD family hydrolase [Oscillospiraceae bacterium]